MPKPWSDVAGSQAFKSLPPEQQDGARRQYFADVVAPRVPEDQREAAFDQFSSDVGIGRRELPTGVKPSSAGGGRGSINPGEAPEIALSQARQPDDKPFIGYSNPMGNANARPGPTQRRSVLEGMTFPEPEFDPAEGERLSIRANNEPAPAPRRQLPGTEMRPSPEVKPRGVSGFLGDAALGLGQGAIGLVKGVADNVNAGDNPVSDTLEKATKGLDYFKSDELRQAMARRDGLIYAAQKNGGELAAARAAFNSIALYPQAGGDVVARGTGSLIPTLMMGAAKLGSISMMATNALSNAGDAASQTAEGLRKLSPKEWADDKRYQSLLIDGMTHEQAVSTLAPIYALPSQALGALTGALSGRIGLERALVGKAGSSVRARLGSAGAELGGEQIETLAPQAVGNLTTGAVDGTTAWDKGLGQAAVDTGLGSLGGAGLAGAYREKPATAAQPSAEQMAKDKGFLVPDQQARIQRMRDAGEKDAADMLQNKVDLQRAKESTESELSRMAAAGPEHTHPAFQDAYRTARADGVKPAEAAARAGITAGFAELGAQAGLSQKAMDAALTAAKKLPMAGVPNFLERYVVTLTGKGMGTPLEAGIVSGTLSTVGDNAMTAAVDTLYPAEDVRSTMNDVQALEAAASPAAEAVDNIGRILAESGLNQPPAINPELDAAAHTAATNGDKKVVLGTLPAQAGKAKTATNSGALSDEPRPQVRPLGDTETQAQAAPAETGTREGGQTEGRAAAAPDAGATALEADGVEPQLLGRNNIPLTEGGKAFKTRKAADDARKLNPAMRVIRADGGYALKPASEAQLAAQEAAARRLRNPQTSPPGQPIPAHAMIAAAGGLAPDTRADMAMQGNVTVGNRKLFAGAGRGLSMERATEKLIEEGYLPGGAGHDQARALIKRSLTVPQYTAEGTERMAEAETQARFDAAQLAEDDAVADIEPLSDNQAEVIDDADIPWDAAVSNASTEDAMRALGFDEQDIQNATTQRPGIESTDSQGSRGPDEGAATAPSGDMGGRESAPSEDTRSRSPTRRQDAEVTPAPAQTPPPSGVSASGPLFESAMRPDGTLAVTGDAKAIREALASIPAKSLLAMRGGILVGRTQTEKAQAILNGETPKLTAREAQIEGERTRLAAQKEKAAAARGDAGKPPPGLSVGIMPNTAELVTVKDGVVFIGKYEAIDFDSSEAITVPAGASDAAIKKALIDGGAMSSKQRVFGGKAEQQSDAPAAVEQDREGLTGQGEEAFSDAKQRPDRNGIFILESGSFAKFDGIWYRGADSARAALLQEMPAAASSPKDRFPEDAWKRYSDFSVDAMGNPKAITNKVREPDSASEKVTAIKHGDFY
jgi:hypothetical protein